jgi:hypothetical protein
MLNIGVGGISEIVADSGRRRARRSDFTRES